MQLLDVRHPHRGKAWLHLLWSDVIMTDQEFHIRHILRIVSSHHFCQNQINRGRAIELQPAGWWTQDGNDVLLPLRAQKNLIFLKHVRHLKPLFFKHSIHLCLRIPELIVCLKLRRMGETEE